MTYWTVLVLTIFVNGQQMQSRLLFPSMKTCGDASAVIYHAYVKTHFKNSMAQCEKSDHTQQGSWPKPKTKTTASVARERNGVMTKLEELEAKRAAAEAAVNAAADTAWDEADEADAAYDAAWDAVDAYKAELKKQEEK
jgi:hypothetical protein